MNQSFVREMSTKAAKRLIDLNLEDNQKNLDQLSIWILSRPATQAENALLLPMINSAKSYDQQIQSWTRIAHALFASIDFRYIK
jgi:hypothetical protein